MEQAPDALIKETARILVVEEDEVLGRSLRSSLEADGFAVATAAGGDEALRSVGHDMPDAIILDLVLPEQNGLSVWRRLRADPAAAGVPMLVLIGEGEHIDKILSLDYDAADFMTRPYSSHELSARLKALLRRTAMSPPTRMIRAGVIEIDLDRYLVRVSGEEVRFTSKEFELLRILVEAKGRVLRREFLLERVWGYEQSADVESRTIDVHIWRLREKLGRAGMAILTVRNVGYRFDMTRALLMKSDGRANHA